MMRYSSVPRRAVPCRAAPSPIQNKLLSKVTATCYIWGIWLFFWWRFNSKLKKEKEKCKEPDHHRTWTNRDKSWKLFNFINDLLDNKASRHFFFLPFHFHYDCIIEDLFKLFLDLQWLIWKIKFHICCNYPINLISKLSCHVKNKTVHNKNYRQCRRMWFMCLKVGKRDYHLFQKWWFYNIEYQQV